MNRLGLFLFLIGSLLIFIGISDRPNVQVQNTKEVKSSKQFQTPAPSSTVQTIELTSQTLVSRVIDGDTIELSSGEKVRYIGIDTPETKDPRKPVQCFGKEAYLKNKELVEGKAVKMEKDISERDKYGRLLRYVFVGDLFINDYLVRQGFARVYSYPPDIKYQSQFLEAERQARENNRGLWPSCK